jgi:hypothetical protein
MIGLISRWTLMVMAAASMTAGAAARLPDVAPPDDESLIQTLPDGYRLEVRADGDLNGDGQSDVAYIGQGEDTRMLHVRMAYRSDVDFGHEPFSQGPLNPYPLGAATMKIARGVLVVEEMSGGTTATLATYRLRLDPKAKRMRLIGLDLKTYSRTYAHDGVEWSWNLLTGVTTRRDLTVTTPMGGAYTVGPIQRGKRTAKPLYLEKLPDSSDAQQMLSGG